MDKLHNFGIQLGYAESALLSSMAFSHGYGFDDVEEAMEDLRLLAKSYLLAQLIRRTCCREFAFHDGYNCCPKCGRSLADVRDVSPADVRDFFYNLSSTDMDGGAGILEYFESKGWNLCGFSDDEPAVSVQAVGRWMGREDEEDRPFMEWTLPDGTSSSTYR